MYDTNSLRLICSARRAMSKTLQSPLRESRSCVIDGKTGVLRQDACDLHTKQISKSTGQGPHQDTERTATAEIRIQWRLWWTPGHRTVEAAAVRSAVRPESKLSSAYRAQGVCKDAGIFKDFFSKGYGTNSRNHRNCWRRLEGRWW